MFDQSLFVMIRRPWFLALKVKSVLRSKYSTERTVTYRFLLTNQRRKKADLFVVAVLLLLTFIKRGPGGQQHKKPEPLKRLPRGGEEKAIEPCRTNYCRAPSTTTAAAAFATLLLLCSQEHFNA